MSKIQRAILRERELNKRTVDAYIVLGVYHNNGIRHPDYERTVKRQYALNYRTALRIPDRFLK